VLFVLGFAVYTLLPRAGQLGDAFAALRGGRWRYLVVAVIGSGLTFATGAWIVTASVPTRLPFRRTVLGQIAGSLMATITPAGLGWVALTQDYLQRAGVEEHTARAATTLNMLLTFVSHIALLLLLLPFLPTLELPSLQLPPTHVIVEVVLLVLVAAGIAIWIPASRRRILSNVIGMLRAAPKVLADPRRSGTMVAAAVAGNVAFAVALAGSVAAYVPLPSFFGVLVAYMVAATAAAISPTPGGLGAMEAALVAALVRLGVDQGAAIAATLTFRLATFWLPLPVGLWALRRGRSRGWL
jgi:uncharacterized membrane protein YbhN (UPF0104 family)